MTTQSIFVTKIREPVEKTSARLLFESIRTFGGGMRDDPIWVFVVDPEFKVYRELATPQVRLIPLQIPDQIRDYPFGDKVFACAAAESRTSADVQSLIWIDLNCLVVQPPVLFDLGSKWDAALRPVHIRNVGLSPSDQLDNYWKGIYDAVGVEDIDFPVTSFVDHQRLRAYFNSHGFAVNPKMGLLKRWSIVFQQLVSDNKFQKSCRDERHRIFLFQALFSALVSSSLKPQRIRVLPETYNYPYNLHAQVLDSQRAAALNDLVCFTFEGRSVSPDVVSDIEIREPLFSWLKNQGS
jgi:hypothetical protein